MSLKTSSEIKVAKHVSYFQFFENKNKLFHIFFFIYLYKKLEVNPSFLFFFRWTIAVQNRYIIWNKKQELPITAMLCLTFHWVEEFGMGKFIWYRRSFLFWQVCSYNHFLFSNNMDINHVSPVIHFKEIINSVVDRREMSK